MTQVRTVGPQVRAALIVAGLVLVKLWLVAWQQVATEAGARFDDELFLNLAHHIKSGEWLGPYDELTLIKGPVYPLWIAANSTMGLPLLTMQTLLHAAGCIAIVLSLQRALPSLAARRALFVALLFDPATYESTAQRVTREGLYTPLTMLLVACLIHVAMRPAFRRVTTLLWCGVCGVLLGAFWLTREEGPWILPAALLLLGYAVITSLRTESGARKTYALAFAIVPVLASLCLALVAAVNNRYYGVATVVELKSSWFEKGYGALARVGPDHYVKWVPVPEPSRELAYNASPAFAQLRVYLDGAADAAPTSSAEDFTLSRFGEMTGTWFIWALRDAAASAGHHTSLPEARRYYEQVATEINAACTEDRISCGPNHTSLAPPLRANYIRDAPSAFGKMADVVLGMEQMEIHQRASVGDLPLRQFYRDMTHTPVEGLDPGLSPSGVVRVEILGAVRDLYALLLYPFTAIACAGLIASLVSAIRTRTMPLSLLVACAMAAAILARLALLTYISLSSYPIYQIIYLRVLYPLLYIVIALGFAQVYGLMHAQKSASARTNHAPPP